MKAFNSWIADFGCPSEIVSDNASYFVSELVKSFIDFSKIKHSTIHPYSHEENGLVDQHNIQKGIIGKRHKLSKWSNLIEQQTMV